MVKPPRLLLVLTEFPPRIGGMQTHALYLSRHFHEMGYRVSVVTYRPSTPWERDAAQELDDGLGFKVHRVLSRVSFWHNIELLRRLARGAKPDLIYCSTVFYGFLRDTAHVPIVARSVGNDVLRPWIAYPFRFGSNILAIPRLDNKLYNFFRQLEYPEALERLFREKRHDMVRQSARQLDLILANSDFTAELLAGLGVAEERVKLLVGGVDAKRFDGGPERSAPEIQQLRRTLRVGNGAYVITTVCRLVAKKGIDFLLRSFPAVRRVIPNAHLLVVGVGHHSNRLRRLARELGLAECVTFAGRVNHLDIHLYYRLSDLFVLASRVQANPSTGFRDAETMGRVLCEANAAGVPVVATRSGGIPSVVAHGENGLLFESDNEAGLLNQIRRIHTDPRLTRGLVRTGRLMAYQRFDWSVVLKAHEGYFATMLDGKLKGPDAVVLNPAPEAPVPQRS